jgi:hypothetical protein
MKYTSVLILTPITNFVKVEHCLAKPKIWHFNPYLSCFYWNNPGIGGVYLPMTFRLPWRRILRVVALSFLVLLAGLAAFVQIQQHILRWRAERLLADIRQIQMGEGDWTSASRFMKR